jgi:hypothetical protein
MRGVADASRGVEPFRSYRRLQREITTLALKLRKFPRGVVPSGSAAFRRMTRDGAESRQPDGNAEVGDAYPGSADVALRMKDANVREEDS